MARKVVGGTVGTALSIIIPFSRRDDVTFRPAFAWWQEQLEVTVKGGSPRGDVGIVWPGVAVMKKRWMALTAPAAE